MTILVGFRLCGKTDEVPGLGFVATRFVHCNFFPLIPTFESFFVTSGEGILDQRSFQGTPVPLSYKSLLLAYWRGVAWPLALCSLFLSGIGVALLVDARIDELLRMAGSVCLLSGLALALSYSGPMRRASWERARSLASQIGVSRAEAITLAASYGRLAPEQAEAQLQAEALAEIGRRERPARVEAGLAVLRRQAEEACARRRAEEHASRAPVRVGRAVPTTTRAAIKFECPHCAGTMKVPRSAVGRLGRCRKCSSALRVPAAAA